MYQVSVTNGGDDVGDIAKRRKPLSVVCGNQSNHVPDLPLYHFSVTGS